MKTVTALEFQQAIASFRDRKYYFTGAVTQTDYFALPGQGKLLGTKTTQYARKNSKKIVSETYMITTPQD